MAVWTLEEAKENLSIWLEAQKAVATSQSYKIGTRALTRANLSEIMKMVQFWRAEVEKISSGRRSGVRLIGIVPRDL